MPHNDCKIPRGETTSELIKDALIVQLKCPACGGPFTGSYLGNTGCDSCGIYARIHAPFVLGNRCRTNYDYLTLVRRVKRFLEKGDFND